MSRYHDRNRKPNVFNFNDIDETIVLNRGKRIHHERRNSHDHDDHKESRHETTHKSSSWSSSHSSSSSLSSRTSCTSICPQGPPGPEGPTGPCCAKTVLFWNSGEDTPNVDNSFIGWGYTTSNPTLSSIIVPFDGTLLNLYAQAPGNSGCTGIVTVYINGSSTSLTATGNGITFSDTIDSASVIAGDLVAIHSIISGQCPTNVIASVELDA